MTSDNVGERADIPSRARIEIVPGTIFSQGVLKQKSPTRILSERGMSFLVLAAHSTSSVGFSRMFLSATR